MLKKGDLVTFLEGHDVHKYFGTPSYTLFTVEEYTEIPYYVYNEDSGYDTDEIDYVGVDFQVSQSGVKYWVDPTGWKLHDPTPKEEQLVKKIKYLWERQEYVRANL